MFELTAEQAHVLVQNVLLGTIKNESKTTKRVLEAVPADKPDYRPDPNAKSAIELVRHIAAADIRFLDTVINGAFDPERFFREIFTHRRMSLIGTKSLSPRDSQR